MIFNGNKKQTKQIIPLAFHYYYIPMIVLAGIAFADSIYLAVSHYRVHSDLSYSSFCAVSRALNCDTVSSSPYAVFLNVPVAIWGAIGYMFVLLILILAGSQWARKKRLWPTLFWISLLYSIGSLILAGISSFLIHSYCIMCLLTYLVNFSLLYYAWFANRRFGDSGLLKGLVYDFKFLLSIKKVSLSVIAGFLILVACLMAGMPKYWLLEPPSVTRKIPWGITKDDHPWIGAENPELIIEEFTDYLCTQCRIKHFYLRRLIAENPGKIRLIHRHFPMDNKFNPIVKEPYHMGAGMLAIFSIYAQSQGKFWEANDMFFQMDKTIGAISSKKIAKYLNLSPQGVVGAPYDRHILYHLQKDIERGLALGLTGTPGYVINGTVFQGYIPPRFLKKFFK